MVASAVVCIQNVEKWRQDTPLRRPSICQWQLWKTAVDKTLCNLLVRKSMIHKTKWLSRPKYETRLFAKMCGCMVLKAEEKSANKILAWVWGPTHAHKVFKMNNSVMASTSLVKLTNVNSVVHVVYSWVGDVIHTFFTAWCYTLPLIVFSAIYSQMNYFFYST